MYCGDLHVVYNDGKNVYKMNIDRTCNFVAVEAKVILQGAYNTTTGLMTDNLRTLNLIPATEPYTGITGFTHFGGGGENVHSSVFTAIGNDAIVDWVFLELRDKNTANVTPLATRAVLIQRDGDIVDCDGYSPVVFENILPNTEYNVVVRHRNHLGVKSLPLLLTRDKYTTKIDFTDPSVLTSGSNAQKNVSGKMCLWAGDVNNDKKIRYNGANNDKYFILQVVGTGTPNAIISGYDKADLNLDGKVRYNGANNDKLIILNNVGTTSPNNIIFEQISN
jgi:hypothetical protein